MKLSENMKKSLNHQITLEAEASSFYLEMASWCEIKGYEGSSAFFYAQSDEERDHMLKIVHYMNRIGTKADITSISEPKKDLGSLEDIIKTSLNNEQQVTKSIHEIITLAEKEHDRRTFDFMQWFVKEQIEEEETFENIFQKFDVIGRDKLAIHEIDQYMEKLANKSSKTE